MYKRKKLLIAFGGTEWNPKSIQNLALWLDSEIGLFQDVAMTTPAVADDAPVGAWFDRSGNGNVLVQATAGNRPLLKLNQYGGKPVLRFDGTDFLQDLLLHKVLSQPITIIALMKSTTSGVEALYDSAKVDAIFAMYRVTDNLIVEAGTSNDTGAIPNNVYFLSTVRTDNNSANSILRIDGNLRLQGGFGTNTLTGFTVGATRAEAIPLHGDIVEILVYEKLLSTAEMIRIEKWIADKYSIPSNLFVFDGDSLTAGSGSTGGLDYPNQIMRAYSEKYYLSYNYGVGGQTTAQMIADAASQVDVLRSSAYTYNIVSAWGGSNDITLGALSAAQIYANIVAYCTARKAAGWTVNVLSILPASNALTPVDFNTKRAAVNGLLRADFDGATSNSLVFTPATGVTYADYFVDIGADTTIGEDGDSDNGTYYDTDKIHLLNAGYAIVATAVKAAIDLKLAA